MDTRSTLTLHEEEIDELKKEIHKLKMALGTKFLTEKENKFTQGVYTTPLGDEVDILNKRLNVYIGYFWALEKYLGIRLKTTAAIPEKTYYDKEEE